MRYYKLKGCGKPHMVICIIFGGHTQNKTMESYT